MQHNVSTSRKTMKDGKYRPPPNASSSAITKERMTSSLFVALLVIKFAQVMTTASQAGKSERYSLAVELSGS